LKEKNHNEKDAGNPVPQGNPSAFGKFYLLGLCLLAAAIVCAIVFRPLTTSVRASSNPPARASAGFAPTVPNTQPPPEPTPRGMVWIPGGEYSMGAADPPEMDMVGMSATTDSRPIHRVYVDGFFMDKTDVTNAQLAEFVKATGYVTIAERTPTQAEFPGAPPENLVAGGVVFPPPDHEVPLNDHFQWWSYVTATHDQHRHPGSRYVRSLHQTARLDRARFPDPRSQRQSGQEAEESRQSHAEAVEEFSTQGQLVAVRLENISGGR
jgi:hypothetical protein